MASDFMRLHCRIVESNHLHVTMGSFNSIAEGQVISVACARSLPPRLASALKGRDTDSDKRDDPSSQHPPTPHTTSLSIAWTAAILSESPLSLINT
jgi:hypothetical protein